MKALLRRILAISWINYPARQLLRLMRRSGLISERSVRRFPIAGPVIFSWRGKNIRMLSKSDDTIAARIFWLGLRNYEPATIDLFEHLLPQVQVFFDIGANTGLFSLLAGSDPARRVFAFEPVPAIANRFEENVALNAMSNVTLSRAALTDFNGGITLFIPKDVMIPTGASTLEGFRAAKESVSVPAIRLDSFVEQNRIERLDLIKMDTEGTEHLVLAGAQRVLKEFEPLIVCEVLSGRTEKHLPAVLEPAGYRYFWITDEGLMQRETIEGDMTYKNTNYLFATPRRLELLKESTLTFK